MESGWVGRPFGALQHPEGVLCTDRTGAVPHDGRARLDPLEKPTLEKGPSALGPETERGESSCNPFGDQNQDRASSFL
jgi:hypothetical protein